VQTAHDYGERIAGLMLVAPADPARFGLQNVITNVVLGAHSIVVASTNDPWMPIDRAAAWAEAWGSELINLGVAGHINVSSGYGAWPRGLAIYRSLRGDVPRSFAQRRAHDALHARDF
jgi:predicted alpha/beta hydrolase family esterase